MPAFRIRPFEARDEARVRAICFETAFFGEPIAPYTRDGRLVTDTLVGCHMGIEPESLFVAEADGSAVGYAAGAVDAGRFTRRCVPSLLPRLLWGFVAQGHILRGTSWVLAGFAFRYGRIGMRERERLLVAYPSALHVNLDRAFRGQGAGSALVRAFLAHAGQAGSRGVHLSTTTPAGRDFFTKLGFREAATVRMPRLHGVSREIWLMTLALPV